MTSPWAETEPEGAAGRTPAVPLAMTADEELVRGLYAQHAGPLLGYVVRLTDGDRHRAEDVVQETLLRAWRHPEALTGGTSPRSWLWTVARHLVVDGYRARRARPAEDGQAEFERLPAGLAEDPYDRLLLGWEIAGALGSLTPEHRGVLLEVYYRGRSVAEAAEYLAIPAGTVKSRTYYALRALKLILEERGIEA